MLLKFTILMLYCGYALRVLMEHPRNEFDIRETGNNFTLYQKHGFGLLVNWEEVDTFPSIDEATKEMKKLSREHKV
jgi:hypothetical protein